MDMVRTLRECLGSVRGCRVTGISSVTTKPGAGPALQVQIGFNCRECSYYTPAFYFSRIKYYGFLEESAGNVRNVIRTTRAFRTLGMSGNWYLRCD